MHRKIDLYRVRRDERGRVTRTEYVCSTNHSKTCREAVAKFHKRNDADYLVDQHVVPLGAEIKGQFA